MYISVSVQMVLRVIAHQCLFVVCMLPGLRNTTGELDFSRYSNNLPGKNLVISLSLAEDFFTIQVSESSAWGRRAFSPPVRLFMSRTCAAMF